MNFWDASALVPVVVQELQTDTVRAILRNDQQIVHWWGTPVEFESALWRRNREGGLSRDKVEELALAVDTLIQAGFEVLPSEEVRWLARRLLADHPLRAADSLQLAAALTWTLRVGEIAFTCLDQKLRAAASAEGLRLLPESL